MFYKRLMMQYTHLVFIITFDLSIKSEWFKTGLEWKLSPDLNERNDMIVHRIHRSVAI
jgi:hypothetical protein